MQHQNDIKIISSMETKEFEFKGLAMNGFIALFVEFAIIVLSLLGFIYFGTGHVGSPIWSIVGLLLACILLTYIAYTTNGGDLVTEYLAQVNTIVIIGFVLWRVETLQQLDDVTVEDTPSSPYNIGEMLEQYCVSTKLYLQHDLTLQQLAISIGTNRTYLSSYFAEQGLTYNAYINRLRVEHFMQLYREDVASSRSTTAQALAKQSGFHSYITFSVVFKKLTGTSVTEWMKVSAPISARHAP